MVGSNITLDIDTLEHDIWEHDILEHRNTDLLLSDFNHVIRESPYLFSVVYIIVMLCCFPLMTVIFDTHKHIPDRWRIQIEACYMAHLALVIILCSFKVAGIIVIIVYSLSDGLAFCYTNRPPPFGLSKKFPFLHYFGSIVMHHLYTLLFLICTATGCFNSYDDFYHIMMIIQSARTYSRRIPTIAYYANKQWKSERVCRINNTLLIPAIEIATLVVLYMYYGPLAFGQFFFIAVDCELSLALHRQYKRIVAMEDEKGDDKVNETDSDEEVKLECTVRGSLFTQKSCDIEDGVIQSDEEVDGDEVQDDLDNSC